MGRLFPIAALAALSGALAGGYMILASAKATTVPVAVSSPPAKQSLAEPASRAVPVPILALAPPPVQTRAPTITAARPPVPLQISRRTTYWVEEAQPSAAKADGAVRDQTDQTAQTDKKAASDAAAKAMIEADGYKGVKSLVRTPDGLWRGLAMRGTVEVAVSVDANGSVSTQ